MANIHLLRSLSIWLSLLLSITCHAQSVLDNCKDQFIGSDVNNAPTIFSSTPEQPHSTNKHLCYRDDSVSFFASEYLPEAFAPRWTAYKLSPENYGENGCATYTRQVANCYFRKESWSDFESCTKSSDPFHRDKMLDALKLATTDFSNTGHDKGHIAPRQAFSWHVCGTYQTFSMANMSPQRGFLNQHIWQQLEQQVLTWAIDHGPIYVVSGTTFRHFPAKRFQVYQDEVLDPAAIYTIDTDMEVAVIQHHTNFSSTNDDDLLHPLRDAKPDSIKERAKNMRMPTGYFKVIYRPAKDNEPAHMIGFLMPHSFENLNMAANSYSNLTKAQAFWLFVSRIDLIEEVSGVRFPGIPHDMKSIWGNDWFFTHDQNRSNLRSSDCGRGNPQGVLVDSTKDERLAACTDQLQ